jgi:Arc/MetJ family transcription regulator
MTENVTVDEALLAEAQRLGRHRNKRAAVSAALREYVLRRQQVQLIEQFGTFEFDPEYDYKAGRKR